MNDNDIKQCIEAAIKTLFETQPDIFVYTSETGQTEWNLAHHLANELHVYWKHLSCDLDVVKRNYGSRRPDIIFHARNTHAHNFLVIELKRDGDPAELENDLNKIKEYWFSPPLSYEFGAVVDIRQSLDYRVIVEENPRR